MLAGGKCRHAASRQHVAWRPTACPGVWPLVGATSGAFGPQSLRRWTALLYIIRTLLIPKLLELNFCTGPQKFQEQNGWGRQGGEKHLTGYVSKFCKPYSLLIGKTAYCVLQEHKIS